MCWCACMRTLSPSSRYTMAGEEELQVLWSCDLHAVPPQAAVGNAVQAQRQGLRSSVVETLYNFRFRTVPF